MKTLQILRHAKSDWAADYSLDHDRPLNGRGVRSARMVGILLSERDEVPDLIISSTALRARTTAELAMEEGSWASTLELDRGLYESGVAGVLSIVAAVADVERLMVVGHQPTWSMLVRHLTGDQVDMKTACVASVGLEIASWAEVGDNRGTLLAVLNPRDYLDGD